MGLVTLYDILKDIVFNLSIGDAKFRPLPTELESDARLADLGLDPDTLPIVLSVLKSRLDGRDVNVLAGRDPEALRCWTLRPFLKALKESIAASVHAPITVYVDDEEENIFVFKRFFGKHLRLVTFTDPERAFAFIRSEDAVTLVVTDESMPGLTGNALCNAIRRHKPYLKFVLITGNPAEDRDLLYNSLRHGRFHDVILKPMDLQRHGQKYLEMMLSLANGSAE
ncbi:MAG: response regulator [Fibrobacteria bacterium]